jgi:hypothetical protein
MPHPKMKILASKWTTLFLSVMTALWPFHEMTVRTGTEVMTEGTEVILGSTADSILVATDSAVATQGMPTESGVQKIYQVGKYGACVLMGATAILHKDKTKITTELSIKDIFVAWIAAHPSASIKAASDGLSNSILTAFQEYQKTHPGFKATSPDYSHVSIGCVGYIQNQGKSYATNFDIPATAGAPVEGHPAGFDFWPGMFIILGSRPIWNEIINGSPGAPFATFKTDPVIIRYRQAQMNSQLLQSITLPDLIGLAKISFAATESEEGRQFDSHASLIAAPNRYAVIDRQQGFKWLPLSEPNTELSKPNRPPKTP